MGELHIFAHIICQFVSVFNNKKHRRYCEWQLQISNEREVPLL